MAWLCEKLRFARFTFPSSGFVDVSLLSAYNIRVLVEVIKA